jgi:inosine-uridine nucleoside N-ribohydrolase
MRVHLDTDFGGDTDDACALAYLLARDDVDLVGVTTVADADGRRAAYVRYLLELAGRAGVPVAAGAARSLTTGSRPSPSTATGRTSLQCPSRQGRRSTCSTGRSPPARP